MRTCVFVLTREMERGMLKSFPPCSLKPHGAGPCNTTLYLPLIAVGYKTHAQRLPNTHLETPHRMPWKDREREGQKCSDIDEKVYDSELYLCTAMQLLRCLQAKTALLEGKL